MPPLLWAHAESETGLEAVAHRLGFSVACGISPDQGQTTSPALAGGFFSTEPPANPWKVDSEPLDHQESSLLCGVGASQVTSG